MPDGVYSAAEPPQDTSQFMVNSDFEFSTERLFRIAASPPDVRKRLRPSVKVFHDEWGYAPERSPNPKSPLTAGHSRRRTSGGIAATTSADRFASLMAKSLQQVHRNIAIPHQTCERQIL